MPAQRKDTRVTETDAASDGNVADTERVDGPVAAGTYIADSDDDHSWLGLSQARRQEVAYCFAGKALACVLAGRGIRDVSIVPDDESLGRITRYGGTYERLLRDPATQMSKGMEALVRVDAEVELLLCAAGHEAERAMVVAREGTDWLELGQYDDMWEWEADSEAFMMARIAFYLVGSEDWAAVPALTEKASLEMRRCWADPRKWMAIEALADELLRSETIGADAVWAIVAPHIDEEGTSSVS